MVGVIIEAVFLAACQVETELFLVAVLVPLVAWLFCLLYCLTGAYCPIICWAIRTPSTAALIMPPA